MERVTGLEPVVSTLGKLHVTTTPNPQIPVTEESITDRVQEVKHFMEKFFRDSEKCGMKMTSFLTKRCCIIIRQLIVSRKLSLGNSNGKKNAAV